jgi:hypothetical protein
MVLENALCFTDEAKRTLDGKPLIDPAQVERAESMFFDELPPNDGHRKNILKPAHTKVGIGVAQPVPTPTELPVPCFAQEFIASSFPYFLIPAGHTFQNSLKRLAIAAEGIGFIFSSLIFSSLLFSLVLRSGYERIAHLALTASLAFWDLTSKSERSSSACW